jgi:orotate phosphoribosyltransferase
MHEAGSICYKPNNPFTFKSGVESCVYVDLRDDLTENPVLLYAFGVYLRDRLRILFRGTTKKLCLIGIATAGTPFAFAAAQASADPTGAGGMIIGARQMRPERKVAHGKSHGWTNSPPSDEDEYAPIEQVASTGGSLLRDSKRLKEDSYPIESMMHLIVVDWEFGARKLLASNNIRNVEILFKMSDIAYAYHKMGLWENAPKDEVERVIRAHGG